MAVPRSREIDCTTLVNNPAMGEMKRSKLECGRVKMYCVRSA